MVDQPGIGDGRRARNPQEPFVLSLSLWSESIRLNGFAVVVRVEDPVVCAGEPETFAKFIHVNRSEIHGWKAGWEGKKNMIAEFQSSIWIWAIWMR